MTRLLAALLTCTLGSAGALSTTGVPNVIDGDTLDIRGQRFRLQGVDAPESAQQCVKAGKVYPCGRQVALALADRVRGRNVRCEHIERDRYGRTVARCYLGAEDLNRWLVRSGLAVAYEEYDRTYVPDEAYAKSNRLGLWAGTFQNPAEYRRNPQNPVTAGTPRSAATPAPGGRTFRSCAEARAAGFTRMRRGQPGYSERLDGDRDGVACE